MIQIRVLVHLIHRVIEKKYGKPQFDACLRGSSKVRPSLPSFVAVHHQNMKQNLKQKKIK